MRCLRLPALVCGFLYSLTAAEVRLQFDGSLRASAPSGALNVYVDAAGPDAPAVLGSTSVENGALVFRPRFPFRPGVKYRAVCNGGAPVIFEIPKPAAAPDAVVEHIYPSASVLPENQLKLYIHFSRPMSRGEAARRIALLDAKGRKLELPFLELEEELWDPEGKRLTLFFDPGRIKRGLVPHNEAGTPLEAGRRYTLVIDASWPDASGTPMREGARKTFTAGPADREPPDPGRWAVLPPRAGGREPLVLDFPEPLDNALLHRLLAVRGESGPVAGRIAVDREERRWSFVPDNPWIRGRYRIEVGTWLEDLAGNRIGKPFDVDVFERIQRRIETVAVPVRFEVR